MDSDEIKRDALSDSSISLVKLEEMVAENMSLFQPVVEIVRVGLSILEKPYETYNPSDPNRHRKTLEIAANLFTGLNSALAPRSFRSSPGDIASLQTVAGPIYEWALVFYQTHFLDIAEVTKDKALLVDVCLQLAKLFQSFSLVQELANIMATTPGFITRVTMLWIHSIWNVLDMRLYYQPTVISLSSHRQVIQRCLDCSIPGDTIAKCCSIMLTQKSISSPSGTYPMDGPIGFVVAISGFSEKFRHALVAKHAPSWLCRQLSIHISKEKDDIDEDPLRTVEVILTGVWRFGLEGPRCIVDMLDSNIVALLSDCASLPGSRCTKESVRLLELIAKFLFYRPIIPRVAKCLRAMDIESLTPGPIRDALLSLKEVTLLRERALENYCPIKGVL
ncbi:hypothetical protein EV421DRAFT_966105 [Armillaria borealis]|uniref:Uncharacterized protein n=1 Tax=Armillaria borealis TaxID=47425 RepID=A0AA39J9F6_9AGAR|nr:hypothetical protein EV421DRAFT_966105 [Armillaria borealis]